MFFKTDNPLINKFNFLKRFVTLYDLLIDLFNKIISNLKAAKEQNEMLEKIYELRNLVLLEEESIKKYKGGVVKKAKNETQRNQTLTAQKSVLKNAIKLYDKRTDIINVFVNEDIAPKSTEVKLCNDPEESKSEPKFEKGIAERTKMRRHKFDEENEEVQELKIVNPL